MVRGGAIIDERSTRELRDAGVRLCLQLRVIYAGQGIFAVDYGHQYTYASEQHENCRTRSGGDR